MRGKQALAAALRAGGASSSSICDVRDVQHPSGEAPLHIRLQEEYELLLAEQDAALLLFNEKKGRAARAKLLAENDHINNPRRGIVRIKTHATLTASTNRAASFLE